MGNRCLLPGGITIFYMPPIIVKTHPFGGIPSVVQKRTHFICSFKFYVYNTVLTSIAAAERLFSKAENVLKMNRRSLWDFYKKKIDEKSNKIFHFL